MYMNIFPGARTIALRRNLDAMSVFYEERSSANRRKHFKLMEAAMPGLSFFFHGLILSACEHFAIDFIAREAELSQNSAGNGDGVGDVLLQIAGRLPQNYIVRNSRLMGKWGIEENSSNLFFQLVRGKSFWIQVLLTEESFYISVNGFHFVEYHHRLPYRWLVGIDVYGDVADVVVDNFYVSEYPIRLSETLARPLACVYNSPVIQWVQDGRFLPREWQRVDDAIAQIKKLHKIHRSQIMLPFYGRIPEVVKLTEGRAIRIEGRVRLMPQSFSVTLQRGQEVWPQPTVSFFFSPSFLRNSRDKLGKAIIARGAFLNGSWVNREVSRIFTNLRPGSAFVIIIACRQRHYEVFVNSEQLLKFKHQMNPDIVDIVNIRGDIRLWEVVIESLAQNTARLAFGRALGKLR
ncbi:32 kDa beta-galactoside-binding lectin [Drosophila tropicalis]|uniref:32 kDa beta-galactoside-binding lectin n=1 Tax=Drosophila tropicalis TaxID=46794 RepID=UPI0035ABE0F3